MYHDCVDLFKVLRPVMSGFVGTMHQGFCEQHAQSHDLTASEFDFLFARAHVHCDNNSLPEPVLNP